MLFPTFARNDSVVLNSWFRGAQETQERERKAGMQESERESTIVPQIGNFGPLVFSFDDISTMMPPAAPKRGGVLCVSDNI